LVFSEFFSEFLLTTFSDFEDLLSDSFRDLETLGDVFDCLRFEDLFSLLESSFELMGVWGTGGGLAVFFLGRSSLFESEVSEEESESELDWSLYDTRSGKNKKGQIWHWSFFTV
jgi:hypothetical protein